MTKKIIAVGCFALFTIIVWFSGYNHGHSDGYHAAQYDVQQAKLDFVANKIIYYESRGMHDGVWSRTDVIPAYGVAQFQRRTFNWMKGLAHRPDLNWKNEDDQRYLLRWALANGYGSHWGPNYVRAMRAYYESP